MKTFIYVILLITIISSILIIAINETVILGNDKYTITNQIKDKLEIYSNSENNNKFKLGITFIYDMFYSLFESLIYYKYKLMKYLKSSRLENQNICNINDLFSSDTLKCNYSSIYSIGPDSIDGGMKIPYDPTNGVFSEGDILIRKRNGVCGKLDPASSSEVK